MQLAMWKNHMQIIHSSDGALISQCHNETYLK